MIMCEGLVYDSNVISTESVMEEIRAKAKRDDIEFEDSPIGVNHYYNVFGTRCNWDNNTRYCYAEWEEEE